MCSLSLALRKVGVKYPHNLKREFGVYGQFSGLLHSICTWYWISQSLEIAFQQQKDRTMIMSEDIEWQIINEGLVPGNLDKINSGSQNN